MRKPAIPKKPSFCLFKSCLHVDIQFLFMYIATEKFNMRKVIWNNFEN